MSTRSTTEADALRAEIIDLTARRGRGDISQRGFERRVGELSLALCRAVVGERLAPGEKVELEHHALLGHLHLTQSVLREPEQDAVSLLLTGRRLVRVRSRLLPGRAFTCDARDHTVVDELPREAVSALAVERSFRLGEAATGALVAGVALLLRPVLSVTGPLLAAVGVLGVLHGLLVPTRTVRVVTAGGAPEDPIRVHAARARSARRVLAALRRQLRGQAGRS